MAIALIEIDRETTAHSLKKAARRHAMTGGFELGIKADLRAEELRILAERLIGEWDLSAKPSERRNSNLGRALSLIEAHPNTSEEAKRLIAAAFEL